MRITEVRRYPVKSMLGERVPAAACTAAGLAHDRGFALVDATTGLVATAKHPRLWRDLLTYSATAHDGHVTISSPAGWTLDAAAATVDSALSEALGRPVHLTTERPEGATVERPDPEDVLDQGVEAEVPAATLEIGQGTPGTTFVDYAPVHLVTTATLDAVGTHHIRYRPNLVVETPPSTPPFVENTWVGRQLRISDPTGGTVELHVALPTPRCAVPTLQHGDLPRDPNAVRALLATNRIEVTGFGVLPCAGCYAEVRTPGVLHTGDTVTLVD